MFCDVFVLGRSGGVFFIRFAYLVSLTSKYVAFLRTAGVAMTTLFQNAESPLEIPFHDENVSGQLMHPSVVDFAAQDQENVGVWCDHRYWAAMSPYPAGNNQYENPCLYFSDDGDRWHEAVSNPLTRNVVSTDGTMRWGEGGAPVGWTANGPYNYDPELVYDRELLSTDGHRVGGLLVYFGAVASDATQQPNPILRWYRISVVPDSRGALMIGPPVPAFTDRSSNLILSPSVVRVSEHEWHAWYCSRRAIKGSITLNIWRVTSSNGLFDCCTPEACSNPLPDRWYPWHLEVRRAGGKYWFLIVATTNRTSFHDPGNLRLAMSSDGLHLVDYTDAWALSPAAPAAWDSTTIYRAAFAIDSADKINIWYSAARRVDDKPIWRIGKTTGEITLEK